MERVMNDTLRLASEQTGFKRKDFVPPPGRAPYPKKGKGSQPFRQLQKGGGSFVHGGSWGELDGPTLGDIPALDSVRS